MPIALPESPAALRDCGDAFASELRHLKTRLTVPDYGWYPYSSTSALPILAGLLEPVYSEVMDAIGAGTVADIGCGDGDLAMFFARLGRPVDAVDHAEANYNQLRGARVLRDSLGLPVTLHDIDLNGPFELPQRDYGFALLLGILYHLKNPYYVLEALAARADWCALSTRIARVTPRRAPIEEEAVAYLLDAREANNDPTNFWIFSAAGLDRLMERTGWQVVSRARFGCREGSDPIRAEADERIFLLARSRVRHPELQVRTREGWHEVEDNEYRWTERRFVLEVTLPANVTSREFALRFFAPDVALASGTIRVRCECEGQAAGAITCDASDPVEFRGRFPAGTREGAAVRLNFQVESKFNPAGDDRDLGICVPLLDESQRHLQRIPFRIS